MKPLTISPLDAFDDEDLAAWHATYFEATVHGREHSTPWMLDHLTTTAATEHGRSIISTEAAYPHDAPADGSEQPSVEFLVHRGFKFGLGDVQRALDLPVDTGLLQRLADEAEPHHVDGSDLHLGHTLRSRT